MLKDVMFDKAARDTGILSANVKDIWSLKPNVPPKLARRKSKDSSVSTGTKASTASITEKTIKKRFQKILQIFVSMWTLNLRKRPINPQKYKSPDRMELE